MTPERIQEAIDFLREALGFTGISYDTQTCADADRLINYLEVNQEDIEDAFDLVGDE